MQETDQKLYNREGGTWTFRGIYKINNLQGYWQKNGKNLTKEGEKFLFSPDEQGHINDSNEIVGKAQSPYFQRIRTQ